MRNRFIALALFVVSAGFVLHANQDRSEDKAGVVFTASNRAAGNEILVFHRDDRGGLSFAQAVPTGGLGTGGGLGNQGGLVLSADSRWLLVVNAGSNDVSVFRVYDDGLKLASRTPSAGHRPISVTIDRDLVYVLNAGGAVGGVDNIAGFRLDRRGRLHPIANAVQLLSAPDTAAAQVGFTPDGEFLVVTERATNLIGVFPIATGDDDDENYGVAGAGTFYQSAGVTPFGFSFDPRGHLLVSEAAGGAPDASTVSSYAVTRDGGLEVISAAVPTTESAACWLVVTDNGRFAFTANTGSGTVSAFRVQRDGGIALLDQDGVAASTGTGSAPADSALSAGSQFLYTRNGGNGTISAFRVTINGDLTPLSTLPGLPAGANGIAAR
jgi:6-phosphogluconolactonase